RRISNKYKMDDVGRVLFSDWTLVKLCRTSMRNAQYHHKKCTEETLAILRLAHERAVDFASTNWTKTSES
ncbi:MAG: hypothetical protein LBQ43_03795, partial [Holosporales bacterium]|nr:hypothetical protein [Holosporales bacterium]